MSFFDECYQADLSKEHKPPDWANFWKSEIQQLASVPFFLKKTKKRSSKNVSQVQQIVQFQSSGGYNIHAQYVIPAVSRKKFPLVIIFPDYLESPVVYKSLLDQGFAQLVIRLRGHEVPMQTVDDKGNVKKKSSYGYFAENLQDREEYYMKKLYLDAYRTLEIISVIKGFDRDRVALWGRGIGGAMGLFATKFTQWIKCQIIQYPSFCYLPLLFKCKSSYAEEIKPTVKRLKKVKNEIFSMTLNYFDASFMAEDIVIPTAVLADLKNKGALPETAFSIFHEIKGDKEIHLFNEVYPNGQVDQEKSTLKAVTNFLAGRL